MLDAVNQGPAAHDPSEVLSDTVNPGDDLFRYVNGPWLESTEIPEDRSRYGSFDVLVEGAERAVRDILDEARDAPFGTVARQLGDLYASFLDDEAVERLGATPASALVETVSSLDTVGALVRAVGEFQRVGLAGFYGLYVSNDPGDPERYVIFLDQGGISLPDESYYREEHFAPVREGFVAHVARTFARLGLSEPEERARRVMELETELARHHWDTVASRDSEKTYNLRTWAEVAALAASGDGDPVTTWRRALGLDVAPLDTVVVRQPSFTQGLAELFDEAHLPAWRDWLRWHLTHSLAPYLSSAFVEENFDFFGRTLTGTPVLRERWKRAVSFVEAAMGEAVGRLYVERHFPPSAKAAMDALVSSLLAAFGESVTTRPWMGEATRARALEKLAKFTPKIGYPNRWRDYSALAVRRDDLVANVLAAGAFEFDRQLAKLGSPLDRGEWLMSPQTVNAYYHPGLNEIVFPAAILQPPFFDLARDDASNYGAIGAIIGHEISHGFDDQGSKFDGSGKLENWWTADDRRAFDDLAERVIAQYEELSPAEVPDQHVNGAFTVGENIGDLGGLNIAWRAYKLSRDGERDDLAAAQRFFVAWARGWRNRSRPADVERRLTIDPHSPPEFRCNQVVRNIDVFYDAFAVTADNELWLAPEKRVTIW